MDPQAQSTAIASAVTLILGVLAWLKARHKPGLGDPPDVPETNADPSAVVQRLATDGIEGLTARQLNAAVAALAQTISVLEVKVTALEQKELAYLKRLAVVEHIATYSTDPPPRQLPPWPDEPGAH